MGDKKLSFGVKPSMKEVSPGKTAIIEIGKFEQWEIIETEWGDKYKVKVNLFSHPHPNYESLPKSGSWLDWVSKCAVAEQLFKYFWEETEQGEWVMKTFDHNAGKLFDGKWKLQRFETGEYFMEPQ